MFLYNTLLLQCTFLVLLPKPISFVIRIDIYRRKQSQVSATLSLTCFALI